MPLLTSPIDGSPMRQINRFGIELDVCPTSGGVWLDRGELEKLMALMKEAEQEEAAAYAPRQRDEGYRQPQYQERGDHHYKSSGHKKKGALHQMMELFEF